MEPASVAREGLGPATSPPLLPYPKPQHLELQSLLKHTSLPSKPVCATDARTSTPAAAGCRDQCSSSSTATGPLPHHRHGSRPASPCISTCSTPVQLSSSPIWEGGLHRRTLTRTNSQSGRHALDSILSSLQPVLASLSQGSCPVTDIGCGLSSQLQAVQVGMSQLSDLCVSAIDALATRERETEHLTAMLKELSETRADAIQAKTATLSSYAQLQFEYHRALKALQNSDQSVRATAARSAALKDQITQQQHELNTVKAEVAVLRVRNHDLRQENCRLVTRVAVLEEAAYPTDCRHQSACVQHLTARHSMNLY